VDEYWDKRLKAGATPTACGWIKDPFGLSWQIVPRRFTELIGVSDSVALSPAVAQVGFFGHAWRIGLLVGIGALVSLATARVAAPAVHREGAPA